VGRWEGQKVRSWEGEKVGSGKRECGLRPVEGIGAYAPEGRWKKKRTKLGKWEGRKWEEGIRKLEGIGIAHSVWVQI
jgi:hypothetical protein